MTGTARPSILVIPYQADPLAELCRALLAEHQASLPDLSHLTVLLNEAQAAPRLRQLLLQQAAALGHAGVVGLTITSLHDWVLPALPSGLRPCSALGAELMLVEALLPYQHLFNRANPWLLADELLRLFDELTLNQADLPEDLDSFIARLQQAYGLPEKMHPALGREAGIVHSLWQAWRQQLRQQGLTDRQTAYLLALANSHSLLEPGQQLWLAGFEHFIPAERRWLQPLLQQQQARLIVHGRAQSCVAYPHPDTVVQQMLADLERQPDEAPAADDYATLLDALFNTDATPLRERAAALRQAVPHSPARQRLQCYLATHAEQEARAIDIQVRRWLLQGKQRIAIVTENRRLARRVRALLERADIHLQDAAGWALSTTRAAAALERWLECIEQDFAHLPLLDLLRSPFIFSQLDQEQRQAASYRLEQDIIRHENIARNLARYRAHILDRRKRLPDWFTGSDELLLDLLQQLGEAAAPLLALLHGEQPARVFLDSLLDSLDALGMRNALDADAAGSRLLQSLEQLQAAAAHSELRLNWNGFRTWLGRHLERSNFRPRQAQQRVVLLGLSQSRLQHFDALVLAGAEQEFLPGAPRVSPFFNDQVRKELGLSDRFSQHAMQHYHIRRLLSAAPAILITARQEQDGEAVVISPWLENLLTLHQQAYAGSLEDQSLAWLVDDPRCQVLRGAAAPLPDLQIRPRPALDPALLPEHYSASTYQTLLDCPYRFYAAYALNLSPSEEIRLALSQADYGLLVHRCLQAFHGEVRELPGPFSGPFNNDSRDAAIALLQDISRRVFAEVLLDNFEHHGLLEQWLARTPAYIDWQIERSRDWQVARVEQKVEVTLGDGPRLKGRLDRVDQQQQQLAILDYKTGKALPKADEVLEGERIQLPFYALLAQHDAAAQPVAEVAYVKLAGADKVTLHSPLAAASLQPLAAAVGARLQHLHQAMQAGANLPAWGDSASCATCDMSLLCRRQAWDNGEPAA